MRSRQPDGATARQPDRFPTARAGWCSAFGAVLLPALLLIGCNEKEKPSAPSSGPQQAPAVIVAPVDRRPVAQTLDFVGRVEALEKVDIRARVTGFLRDRHFQEGQLVKEGDLLSPSSASPSRPRSGRSRRKSRAPRPR